MHCDEHGTLDFCPYCVQDETAEDTVTISKAEYESLLSDSDLLACLQAAGVDNWDGYCEAQEML